MHLGEEILAELGRHGRRYGRLSDEEHQQLKQVVTSHDLNAFLAANGHPPVTDGADVGQIVAAVSKEWEHREAHEIKRTAVTSVLRDPVGLMILIALSPLFLAASIVRWVRRLRKTIRGDSSRKAAKS